MVLGLCAGLTVLRDPVLFESPAAPYEDGRDVLGFFYNHPEPGSILRSYNGYVSVIPNAAGYLSARLPVRHVPAALALFGLGVAGLAFSGFAGRRFRAVLASDGLRWLACLVLAAVPLGNYLFVSSTAYSVWNLLFLLILLSLAGAPTSTASFARRSLAGSVLIASHPLSIALIPVWWTRGLVAAARPTLARGYATLLTAVAVLYQWLGVEHVERGSLEVVRVARVTGLLILERVFFNTLLSDRMSRALHRQGSEESVYWTGAAVLLGVLVASGLLWRRLDPVRRWSVLGLLYLIVALTALYVVGRSGSLDVLTGNPGYRYFWVQRMCLLLVLAILAGTVLSAGSWRRRATWGALLALLLAGVLVRSNRLDNAKYRGRPGMARKLALFLQSVEAQEQAGAGVEARHERGAWSIELRRPER